MTKKNDLRDALDVAALNLLKRHFPVPQEENAEPAYGDATEQTKAFQAVVAYYGPRTKLGGNEDEGKENGITNLRRRLHGRGKAGRHPGAAKTQSRVNGAAGTPAAAPDTNPGSAA